MSNTIADGWYKVYPADEPEKARWLVVTNGTAVGGTSVETLRALGAVFERAVIMTQAEYNATIARLTQERDGLRAQVEERRNEAMRALEDLTPGGSEFHDSPRACAAFVQRSLQSRWDAILRLKRENNSLRAQLEAQGQWEAVPIDDEWAMKVKVIVNDSTLAHAGYELSRLVNFALKTQHDEQFARDVDACVKSFWARCERERRTASEGE